MSWRSEYVRRYGRQIYNWDVQILYNKNDTRNHPSTVEKFTKEFDVFSINANQSDLHDVNEKVELFLNLHPSEFFYIQKEEVKVKL